MKVVHICSIYVVHNFSHKSCLICVKKLIKTHLKVINCVIFMCFNCPECHSIVFNVFTSQNINFNMTHCGYIIFLYSFILLCSRSESYVIDTHLCFRQTPPKTHGGSHGMKASKAALGPKGH